MGPQRKTVLAGSPRSTLSQRTTPRPVIYLLSLILSPGAAFAFGCFGYYALAGFSNIFTPDSSLGGILSRAFITGIVILAWLRVRRLRDSWGERFAFAGLIFVLLYLMRMIDNVWLQGIVLPPDNTKAFLFFIISSVIPALLIAQMAYRIDDRAFRFSMSLICMVFLAAMLFNLGVLQETVGRRLALDKINPISLAHLALGLVFYYMLTFRVSMVAAIEAAIAVPLLLLIILYAQSRGVWISGTFAIGLYVVLLGGGRRLLVGTGVALSGGLVFLFMTPDQIDVIVRGMSRVFSDSDLSTMSRETSFYGAWNQFVDDPGTGRYIIDLTTNYYVHNVYLESLTALGIVGSFFLVLHLGLAFFAAVRIVRMQNVPLWQTFAALIYFKQVLANAASGALYTATELWILSFLLIALQYGRPDRRYPPTYASGGQTRAGSRRGKLTHRIEL